MSCGCGVVLCVGVVSVALFVGVCGVQGVCCDAFKRVCVSFCVHGLVFLSSFVVFVGMKHP